MLGDEDLLAARRVDAHAPGTGDDLERAEVLDPHPFAAEQELFTAYRIVSTTSAASSFVRPPWRA